MDKNKEYYLGMYEKAVPKDLSWKEKLEACKKAGFDWLEISIDESDERISRLYWDETKKKELLDLTKEVGLPIWTMCFSCQRKYSLGSIDSEREKKALELMELAIYFASYMGIRIIQLAGYDTYYEESNALSKVKFIKNLKRACELASKKGVILAFETMMDREFISTVSKAMEYVNICNSPYLNVYPDIGNLEAARIDFGYQDSVVEDIYKGKGHIVATHLKETAPKRDRNVKWGEGITNYIEDIKALKECGVSMFNGEFWCNDENNYLNDCIEANQFLRNKLNEIYMKNNS